MVCMRGSVQEEQYCIVQQQVLQMEKEKEESNISTHHHQAESHNSSYRHNQSQSSDQSVLVIQSPLYPHPEQDSLLSLASNILSYTNRSLNDSFRRISALQNSDLSQISRKLQHSIQSDLSLFTSQQEISMQSAQLADAIDNLLQVVLRIRKRQECLTLQNSMLSKRLEVTNSSSLNWSSINEQASSVGGNIYQGTQLQRCIRYKNKYYQLKEKCEMYKLSINNVRNALKEQ